MTRHSLAPDWKPPARAEALAWWLRARLLAARHAVRELWRPSARRWPVEQALIDAPVLAQVRTPLWEDGRVDEEFPLVAGKVQNLRVARLAFHAVEVPAGEVLGFWRQLGRPTAARGFTIGREVRAGCVVPTLAGGICQLSNALATAASRAGMALVERHAHSARIEGAALQPDAVDATVFWNYIDLKLRAAHPWRIEVELSATELVLTLRGHAGTTPHRALPAIRIAPMAAPAALPVARGCLSCDETQCFRHRPQDAAGPRAGRTAALLDAWSPEFARYLATDHPQAERFVPVPMRLAFWRSRGPGWDQPTGGVRAWAASGRRALWQRLWARHAGGRRQASLVDGQRWLARAYARRLRADHTALVVDQGLLPHLASLGVLDGRRVEVLAGALPMAAIEAQLDAAARRWPDAVSLRDFRAPDGLVQAERAALARADRLVTAHAQVGAPSTDGAAVPVTRLDWVLPVARPTRLPSGGAGWPVVVFPAPPLPRKGVLELVAALRGLRCRVRILGSAAPDVVLWAGVQVERHRPGHGHWLDGAALVVLPAHVEHAPRALLLAVASGVPVVATAACGLGERDGLQTVAAGDVEALRAAIARRLSPGGSA